MILLHYADDYTAKSLQHTKEMRAKLLALAASLAKTHDEIIELNERELALIEKVNAARDAMKKEGNK